MLTILSLLPSGDQPSQAICPPKNYPYPLSKYIIYQIKNKGNSFYTNDIFFTPTTLKYYFHYVVTILSCVNYVTIILLSYAFNMPILLLILRLRTHMLFHYMWILRFHYKQIPLKINYIFSLKDYLFSIFDKNYRLFYKLCYFS